MRGIAQVLGWIWVGFNGLACVYGLLSQADVINGELVFDVIKGMSVFVSYVLLASPGILLVWWGRRGSRKTKEHQE